MGVVDAAASGNWNLTPIFPLRELMTPPEPPKRPIGFVPPQERKKEKPAGKKR